MNRLISRIAIVATVWIPTSRVSFGKDVVRVRFDPAVREYCHLLRFPAGWRMEELFRDRDGTLQIIPRFDLGADYEFRVPGLLETKFLVRGVERLGRTYYTTNLYEVDLSDPTGIAKPATEKEWGPAAVVPLVRDAKGMKFRQRGDEYAEVRGVRFTHTGEHWENTLISPDQSMLVMESWSGKLGEGGSDIPGNFPLGFDRNHGKFFFDLYNVDTGKKLFTITAAFSTVFPNEVFPKTACLTERYFLIPLDERRNRCLVCDFGRKH